MDKKGILKAGVIGCGTIFNKAHLYAWIDSEDTQLIAFYDVDQNQSERTKQRYISLLKEKIKRVGNNIPKQDEVDNFHDDLVDTYEAKLETAECCSDARELINRVDIVDICTPVKWHTPYSVMGLEQDTNVMSEKPMARTFWEAKTIVTAAGKSKGIYQLNDDNIFLPRYQLIKNLVESGVIGDVQCCWICRGSQGPRRGWFWNPVISGGGCLMDYGTHAVTSLWYLIGFDKEPMEVQSIRISTKQRHRLIGNRLQKIRVEDDAHFKVMFRDPVSGSWITLIIEATWSGPELGDSGSDVGGYIRIEGSDGELVGCCDAEGQDHIKVRYAGGNKKLIRVPQTVSEIDPIEKEIRNFVSCVREKSSSILNEAVGVSVMEILGSAYLSEVHGRSAVTLQEFRKFNDTIASSHKGKREVATAIIYSLMEPFT